MSDVVNEVKAEAQKVAKEVEQFFVLERAALQKMLDYFAKKPYAEVFELIETMKTAKLLNTAPTAVAPTAVDPSSIAAQVKTGDTTNS